MGSGADDPEKYDPAASRETLDHSAMFIFAVALEDGVWHHETSYAPERAGRPETVALWRKIRTVEDAEWNARFYGREGLERDHGARAVVTFADGRVVEEEIAVARAHPRGEAPFGRSDYVGKFRGLSAGSVSAREAARFLAVVERLPELAGDELAGLNVTVDEAEPRGASRDDRGIF